jgi:iron complex transport system substrate-binding protein
VRIVRAAATAFAAATAVAVVLSGCSSEAAAPAAASPQASAAFPTTVTAANGAVTIAARPSKIVSLSPTATEDLMAIGAGSQVVAVDDQSNYPKDAPKTSLSGLTPNVEAIAGYNPDLVVVSEDAHNLVASLAKLKVPVLRQPAAKTFADVYTQLTVLGKATGHQEQAARTVSGMKSRIAAAATKKPAKALTYYYELDPTFYSATSTTFVGQVFELLGMKNVADRADKQGTGYPQLSAEYLAQSAPDFIFLADTKCCEQSAATVAARPAWAGVPAVRNHHVIALDDDIASRWGPRVADLVETIADAVAD